MEGTSLPFPGEAGFPVVRPVPGEDLQRVSPGEVQAGKDLHDQAVNLGKGQKGFF